MIPYITRKKHKKEHSPSAESSDSNFITPIELPHFFIDPDYTEIYTSFRKHIESSEKDFPLSRVINFQLKSFENQEIADYFTAVYKSQNESFKVAISFSYILMNKDTGELVLYIASRNNQKLFDKTELINCNNDYKVLYDAILNIDLAECATYPNTKFVYVKTTNVVFYITKIIGAAIGCGTQLPDYLVHNKGLISLVKSAHSGKVYSDNLCFFRALALFRGFSVTALEMEAKRLCKQYSDQVGVNMSDFRGITLEELEQLSKLFGIGINVYFQGPENRETKLIFRSLRQDNILYLNLFERHFSYISCFQKYTNNYRCTKCSKLFQHNGNYRQHMKTCNSGTRKVYCNGIFRLPLTIFEELENYGVNIPLQDRVYKYRMTFDCEVFLTRGDTPPNTLKVEYSHKHHLASVSVSSNVPGFQDPRCFVSDGSPKDLMLQVVKYMLIIANTTACLLQDHFSEYIEEIAKHEIISEKFNLYIKQVPVLGFNNAKYDINIIRDYLIPILVELDNVKFVIKKGTYYNCIMTENLRILDICSYLAPGFDYNSFLCAYGASAKKSWFP